MEKVVLQLWSDRQKALAIEHIRHAEKDSRFELAPPVRSLPQNARLHALLTNVRKLAQAQGMDYTIDQWKALFLHAAGFTTEFLPGLEGGWIPYRPSTASMGKAALGELMDFIEAWTAQNLDPNGWGRESNGNIPTFLERSRFALMDKSADHSSNPEGEG